jgi:hypothetical protein
MPVDQEAALARAQALLQATAHFDELGLSKLACEARTTAWDVRELAAALRTEQGLRRALQARCAELQGIVGKAAYQACVKATAGRG